MAEENKLPIASSSTDESLISTFVCETLNNRNYKVHLDRQDIVNIARIEYGWCIEDTNIFRVINDLESDKEQLEIYLNMIRKQEKRSVTLIISSNHLHWVTLVITNCHKNTLNRNILAYYADSTGDLMPQLIGNILTGIDIEILSQQQDQDGCNSGFFALENARVINEALKEGTPVDLSRIPNREDSLKLRRSEIAIALKNTYHSWQSSTELENYCRTSSKVENSSTKYTKSINVTEKRKKSAKVYYSKRTGTAAISGQLYETRLAMLVLKRALKNNKIVKFNLGTNIDGIGVFDDLILSCHYNDNRHRVVFLQAKHRDDPGKNKITFPDFVKENGDIGFHRCFDSYLKIRRNFNSSRNDEVFKSEFRNIDCDLVVFTSANENFGSEHLIREINPSEDDLLQTNSRGKIFQFNWDEVYVIEQVMTSASISRMKQLAESLAKFIFSQKSNCSNMMSDELIRTYHAILARKVIKVAEQGKDDRRDGTIRPEFYENNESLVSVLREALYKESVTYVNAELQASEVKALIEETIKNPSKENVSKLLGNVLIYDAESNKLKFHSKSKLTEIDDVKKFLQRITEDVAVNAIAIAGRKKLESISFPLHIAFGNFDFKVKGEQRLKHVTQKLVELVTKSKIEDNKIVVKIDGDMVGPMRPIKDGDIAINGGIGGLVGNLLVLDDETKMLKFTNDREILPENAKKLFSMLQNDLSEDQLKSARFHITLNDFPLLSLECEESLVKDFLKKLKIYTNQAKEDEVENILKKEISTDYGPSEKKGTFPYRIKSDAICLKVHDEIQKWWKLPKQGFYLTETCELFREAQKSVIDSPFLGVLHFLYLNRIKQYNIEFDSSAIDNLELGNFLANPDVQFETITTTEIELTAIKLLQYSEEAKIEFTFLDLDYVFARDCYREAIGELKTEETVLIIIWGNEKFLNEFLQEIPDIYKRKKTILLTGNSLYDLVKGNLPKESSVKIDFKIDLVHLALKSQEELLKEKEIRFQGKKIKLGELIDIDSKDLVHGDTLSKLLRNELLELGQEPTNDVEPYYIEREVSCFLTCMKPTWYYSLKYETDDIFALSTYQRKGFAPVYIVDQFVKTFEEIYPTLNQNQPEKFIILRNETAVEEFKILCRTYQNRNIHWLECYNDKFILKQTYGNSSNIGRYTDDYVNVKYWERDYSDKFISNEFDNKLAVISAEPGMGKSSVLTNMMKYLRDNYSSMWLVRINLNDYTQILEFYNFSDGLNSTIDFLSTIIGVETDLEKDLFERSIKENGKVVLFFDGFDEISPNYESIVVKLLKILKNTKVERILVTTRPYHFESDLMNGVNALKLNLIGFDEKCQIDFLKKFWRISLCIEISNDHRANIFASYLLMSFMNSINDYHFNVSFLSIPLHCMLFADYFKENFKEFYDSGADQVSNELKEQLNVRLNLSSLYREFVKRKYFQVYCKDKKKKDLSNVDVSREEENRLYPEFLREHRLLALLALLRKSDFNKILSETEKQIAFRLRDEFQKSEGKEGIIDKIVDGKPQFIHRTFAEYFAACYFWEKYKSIKLNQLENFLESIFIIAEYSYSMKQTCRFFELEAQRELKNQLKFVQKEEKLEFLLSPRGLELSGYFHLLPPPGEANLLVKIIDFHFDGDDIENMDIVKRLRKLVKKEKLRLLSIYCELGLIKLIGALAKMINQQMLKNDLKSSVWHFSPLRLAAYYGHLGAVKILIDELNYSPTWTDSNETILLEDILINKDYNVMRSCIEAKILNIGRPYYEWYNRKLGTKLVAFIDQAPIEIVELMMENINIEFFNCYKFDRMSSVVVFTKNFCQVNSNLLDRLIKKGMDVNASNDDKLKPIHVAAYQLRRYLFHPACIKTESCTSNVVDPIQCFLENGAIYNLKDEFGETVLDYVKQGDRIRMLLQKIYDNCNSGNQPIDDVLTAVAKRTFQLVIQRLHANYLTLSYTLLFPPLFQTVISRLKSSHDQTSEYSGDYENKISRAESVFYEILSLLESSRKATINTKLIYPYNLIYEHHTDRLLNLIFKNSDFHIFKDNDEAFSALENDFKSAVDQIESILRNIPGIESRIDLKGSYRLFEIDKILVTLSQEKVTLDKGMEDLISKIHEVNGTEYLYEILFKLKRTVGKFDKIFDIVNAFSEASKTFQLLTTIDESFSIVQSKDNNQAIIKLLQEIEPNFLKAIMNARNENQQTLLDLAEDLKNIEMVELLKSFS